MTLSQRILAGLVAGMTVLAATATAASAGGPGASTAAGVTWETYPCRSAAFDVRRVTTAWSDVPNVLAVSAPGEVACGVDRPGPRYAVAIFWTGVPLGYINLEASALPYASPTGPSRFVVNGGVEVGKPTIVCVVADTNVRLACLLVDWIETPAGASRFVVQTVSTSDPRVTVPVLVESKSVDPNCSTCWNAIDPT